MVVIPKKGTILIVEDQAPLARALMLKLQSAGFNPEVLDDGREVVDRIKKTHYDLVILDLVMPNKDGFEVLAELREADKRTPVIIWSNLSQPEDIARAKELGAVDYWVKLGTPLAVVVERIVQQLTSKPRV
ncbi:MAG: response regulator [bacterium]|nr:response regulator [bacterium]MDZ4284319.1 response regulator [Patescibacteria group bacterium]